MKKTTKILYTTAIAAMIAAASPVMAQSGTSSSTGTGSTSTGSGSTSTGPSGTGTSTTSPAGSTMGGSTGNNATGRSTGNSTTANDSMSNMNVPGWETENTYWRSHYSSRPYYNKSTNYSMMEPAYRFGVQEYHKNNGKRYEDLDQTQLRADWEKMRGTSTLSWDQAQDAVKDSYNRMHESKSGSTSGTTGTSGSSTSGTRKK